MGADEEERWGLAHYHTLTVLFAAYAVGMYAKGAMSLGIFGMSKVSKTLHHTRARARGRTRVHTRTHLRTYARTYARTHLRTHTRAHARTHAHPLSPFLSLFSRTDREAGCCARMGEC